MSKYFIACKLPTVQSVSCFRGEAETKVLAIMTKSAESLFKTAQALERLHDWSGAEDAYRQAAEANPNLLEAHHNRAAVLRRLDRADEALVEAVRAAQLAPDHPTVRFSLGLSQEKSGDIGAAINSYRETLSLNPDHVGALNNLGRLLESQNQTPEAISILEKAYALAPRDASIMTNLANSRLQSGQPQAASGLLDRAIEADPNLAVAYNSRGIARHILGTNTEAIDDFRQAVNLQHDFAEAHENLTQVLMYVGNYDEAWREYEWRWKNPSNVQTKRLLEIAPWDGAPLAGKTLLVHAEQGFGDCLQFSRFIQNIEKDGGKIVFACHRSLFRLMTTMPEIDELWDIDNEFPAFDWHIPLISLPRLFRIEIETVPNETPYLDISRLTGDLPELPEKRSDLRNIGIAWAGRPRHEFDPYRNRSCPIEAMELLATVPNIHLYSLQTGEKAPEIEEILQNHENITDLSPFISDFADTAALVNVLDLIITVDTAVAHLAGAMGKPCWVLLTKLADWRWQPHNGEPPVWYPSMRYFRQEEPGGWTDVFNRVADLLVLSK